MKHEIIVAKTGVGEHRPIALIVRAVPDGPCLAHAEVEEEKEESNASAGYSSTDLASIKEEPDLK